MKTKTYTVWITLHGSSAQNAGIIGTRQKTRASWASGRLEYVPVQDGTQQSFSFIAADDAQAYVVLTWLFQTQNPRERRPLAGKSYLRLCRASLKKVAG